MHSRERESCGRQRSCAPISSHEEARVLSTGGQGRVGLRGGQRGGCYGNTGETDHDPDQRTEWR